MKESSTNNHLDTPTPRCFPDWMRRINPYLKREDTNALFEMQIRMEKIYGKIVLKITPRFVIAVSIPVCFIMIFLFKSIIPIYVMLAFILVAGATIIDKRSHNQRRPFQETFFLSRSSKALLIDLWLSGIGGKEIIEGAYILRRRPIIFIIIFLWLIFTSFFIFFWVLANHQSFLVDCFCITTSVTMMGYFFIQVYIYKTLQLTQIDDIRFESFKQTLEHQEETFASELSHPAYRHPLYALKRVLTVISVVLVACAVITFYLILCHRFFWDYFSVLTLTVTCMILGIWGYILTIRRRQNWFRDMRKTLKYLNELDELYPDYFRAVCFDEEIEEPNTKPKG